jgi:xanthine dehydrogenase/oxidase
VSEDQKFEEPLRRPIITVSSLKQATGEAIYVDDIPQLKNELHGALVLSTRAHAKIISVDESEAVKVSGVHAFYSSKDIPYERNKLGVVIKDEKLFEKDVVTSVGLIIGVIVADTRDIAKRAARLVKVVYEDCNPIIVSIEDAIKHKSYFPGYPMTFCNHDTQKSFEEADHIIEGTCRMGGQEHFYMETQCAIAIPRDPDEMEIFASTQNPSLVQRDAASVLGLPFNRVLVRTKRVGGAFGGKENKAVYSAIPAAFAAQKLGKPVRVVLDRDEDMMITGNRHPFLFNYRLAVRKDGLVLASEVEIFCNAGYSMDYSFAVLQRAAHHVMNAYKVKHMKIIGSVMR